jgi:hypothetical protein
MKYVEYLYNVEHAYKYGIVKIIPPENYRPALAFDIFSNQKLPTRYQVLQELSQGKVSNSILFWSHRPLNFKWLIKRFTI